MLALIKTGAAAEAAGAAASAAVRRSPSRFSCGISRSFGSRTTSAFRGSLAYRESSAAKRRGFIRSSFPVRPLASAASSGSGGSGKRRKKRSTSSSSSSSAAAAAKNKKSSKVDDGEETMVKAMSASIEGVNGDDEGDDSSAMEGGDRDGGHDDGFDVPLYDSVIALKLAPGALPCMPLRSMHHPQLVELSGESFDVLTRARSGSRGGPEYWGLFSEGEDGSVCTTGVYCRLIHAPYQGYQGGLYDAVI